MSAGRVSLCPGLRGRLREHAQATGGLASSSGTPPQPVANMPVGQYLPNVLTRPRPAPVWPKVTLLTVLALGPACAPAPPDELLFEPDEEASGALGERGPWGARVAHRSLEPAESGAVDADVFVPFDGPQDGPFPVVIFVQGGAVAPERYRWLGGHLATRGVVVAAPSYPFDLALLAVDHSARALGGLRAASDNLDDELAGLVGDAALVCGHSLGGVVAAKAWLAEPDFAALALFASFPDEADSFEGRDGAVLSVVGSADAKSAVAEVVAGAAAFEAPRVVVVDEMTHYQWTDSATEGEIDGDAVPTLPDEEVRRVALAFVDALVEEVAGSTPWPFDDEASWPAGSRAP